MEVNGKPNIVAFFTEGQSVTEALKEKSFYKKDGVYFLLSIQLMKRWI